MRKNKDQSGESLLKLKQVLSSKGLCVLSPPHQFVAEERKAGRGRGGAEPEGVALPDAALIVAAIPLQSLVSGPRAVVCSELNIVEVTRPLRGLPDKGRPPTHTADGMSNPT